MILLLTDVEKGVGYEPSAFSYQPFSLLKDCFNKTIADS
jgi:hypothetical protein